MSSHQVAIGADVRTSDGRSIGKVEHLIIDSETKALSAVVADKGIFDGGRVVDLEYVKAMSEEVVTLSLTEEEAKALPGFVHHEFVRIGDSPGMTAGLGAAANFGAAGSTWMQYGPSAGGLPSTGAYSYNEPIVAADEAREVVSPLTDSEVPLSKGTDVVDAAGEKIGVIHDVVSGDDDTVEGFIVQQGFLFHHDVQVPMEWVAAITHEHVRLSVTKDQVEQSRG